MQSNLARHLGWIEQASQQRADLVIFPELSLTGYMLQDLALEVAIQPGLAQPVFRQLLEAAVGLDVMVSFVEVDERSRFYISSAYLSQGEILHVHRKVYLPTYGMFDEKRFFTPGNQVRALDTRFGRAGILVCEDFWHLSLPYLLWQDGADLFFFHAASPAHGLGTDGRMASEQQVDALLGVYASLFTGFVAYTNRVGYEDGLHFPGGAQVIDPSGRSLLLAGSEEGMYCVDIDLQQIRRTRFRLPLLRDEQPELVLRELQRILNKR